MKESTLSSTKQQNATWGTYTIPDGGVPFLGRWEVGYQFLKFYLSFMSGFIKLSSTSGSFNSLGMGSGVTIHLKKDC